MATINLAGTSAAVFTTAGNLAIGNGISAAVFAEFTAEADLRITRNVTVSRGSSGFDFGNAAQFKLSVDGTTLDLSS